MSSPLRHKVLTKAIENSTSCEWIISEASLRSKSAGKCIKTPYFNLPGISGGKWLMEIYPNGYDHESLGFMSVYVQCKTTTNIFANISFKVVHSKCRLPTKCTFTKYVSYHGFSHFINRSDLFNPDCKHMKKKQFKIICNFDYAILQKPLVQFVSELSSKLKLPTRKLDQCLLKSGEDLTDCTLVVEEKEIKVHKLVLYVRSRVFRRMFETPMIEGRENRVIIQDFTYKIVELAMGFFYSGEIKDLSNAAELLRFADKYDVTTLKAYIEALLIPKINVDTVCELIQVADRTISLTLRGNCIKFMIDNIGFLPSFKGFGSLHPEIIKEVLNGMQSQSTC